MDFRRLLVVISVLAVLSLSAAAQGQGMHEPGTGLEDPELRQGPGGPPEGAPALAGEGMGPPDDAGMAQPELYGQGMQLQRGLQNALGNVNNTAARQRLETNMERFQEHYQQRLALMEGLEVTQMDEETGAITLRAREEVRYFGFIKGRATKRFMVSSDGNVTERGPWYRFLYSNVE